jgi:hypothetical protein
MVVAQPFSASRGRVTHDRLDGLTGPDHVASHVRMVGSTVGFGGSVSE